MKKTFTLMLLALATLGTKAGEYVVYQPSSPESVYYTSNDANHQPSVKFPFIKAGDVIKIHYTNVSSECAIMWRGKTTSEDWKWESIGTGSNGILSYTVPSSDQTYASETCTSDEIVASLKERGLTLTGTFKLLAVTVTDNNSQLSNTSQTLFTGQSYNLGNWVWDNRITLPMTYNFAQVKVGDVMTVSYTSDATISNDVAAINLKESQNTSHSVLASIDNIAQNTSGSFDIVITADILNYLQGGYGYITGKYITITALGITSTNKVLSETISTDSKYFGNWSSNYEPSSTDCANTNEGDVLCISFTVPNSKTDGCIFLRDKSNSWGQISGYVVDNLSGSGTVYFPINSTILALLKAGNIAISGSGAGGSSTSDGVQGTGVTITHFTTAAGYRPVYIPTSGYATFYGSSTCALPDGVSAYYVGTVEDNKAKLTSICNIPANQGVILQGTTGIYQLYTTTDDAASVTNNKLSGATTQTTMSGDGNYILYNNNSTPEFRKATASSKLDAYKAYLPALALSAPSLSISFDEMSNTTGISNVQKTVVEDNRIFNLNGQEVKVAKRGLFIKNGKKYFVK